MVQAPTDAEAEKVANFIHGEVRTETPGLSLPKGGGAIRGIGEKFAPNPVTGTGSMSVPLAISPGRSAFGPQLSLAYDSGAGNGPFGVGWSLSLPAVTRKADKGLPQYRDGEESDVFLLPGEIFERSGNLHVVGVAGEFGGVFEDALALPPDVVLIDTAFPHGLSMVRLVKQRRLYGSSLWPWPSRRRSSYGRNPASPATFHVRRPSTKWWPF